MIDFEQARDDAFNIVENTRTVRKVSQEIKSKAGSVSTIEFWLVAVEVPMEDRIHDFTLEVTLKTDFPLSLPTVKLCESDFEKTKYLPHIDTGRSICLFDQENIKQDVSNPAGIVNECINQAVRILSDGLNKNRLEEFNDELFAYWENAYDKNDEVVPGYLGANMQGIQVGNITAYYLVQPHANVNLYVGNQEDETEKLIGFFKLRGHTVQEMEAFYLGGISSLVPPFNYDNKSLLSFIKLHFGGIWKEVKGYLNRYNNLGKFLIFSVEAAGKSIFFGFYIHPFKKNFKGWRVGQSTIQIMTTIRPTSPVSRVRFAEFHPERLRNRTDGCQNPMASQKIMIAGLGSIGSHLTFYLNALHVSKYVLVDPDNLAIENINRHLLSFNEVGMKKVDAMAKYIKYANPFVDIQKHVGSITELLQRGLSGINDLDLIFCAIGKDAIETYLLQCLSTGAVQKPVFLFWVEPYLLGAHVLYINPGTSFSLVDLDINGFYKFNVISEESYKAPDKRLMLREAGCQGSYMPYGKAEILNFFGAFTPFLFDVIQNPPQANMVFTYAGKLSTAISLDLQLSTFANSLSSGKVFIQHI